MNMKTTAVFTMKPADFDRLMDWKFVNQNKRTHPLFLHTFRYDRYESPLYVNAYTTESGFDALIDFFNG